MNREIMNALFADAVKLVDQGMCPTCAQPLGEFKDELSRKEARISGMCQACQDSVFDCDDDCECEEEDEG